tara:strand:+ start:87 stop:665 length:579 start_codon:yes stop_codon:yes gene_type:complete
MSIYSTDLNTPPDLIKYIEQTVADIPKEPATVHRRYDDETRRITNTDVRSCHVQACNFNENWIPAFFDSYIRRFNQIYYKYDIAHLRDNVQHITYDVDDHYKWHIDSTMSLNPMYKGDVDLIRKISFSFMCNDDYEGGELEFFHAPTESTFKVPAKAGRLVVFPSDTRHRVLPVTKGQRRSIVGWMVGPPWK